MSWQEELRKLDEELAAGRLSADEYRVRRDAVLSSAAGTSAPAPATPPPGVPQQSMPAQPQPGWAPPAQQPHGTPAPGDRTQIVQPSAESTQIVPQSYSTGPQPQQPAQWQAARPPGDGERTQVVPGVPQQAATGGLRPPPYAPQQQPGFGQQPVAPPWQSDGDMGGSPWGGTDFPPLAGTGSPDWIRQGPEVFDEAGSGKGRKIGLIALAVVLVAAIGAGVFYFVNKKSGDTPQGQQSTQQSTSQQPPSPTTTTKPRPTDPNQALLEDMPLPPASQQQQAKIWDLAELAPQKLMDQPEIAAVTASGATKVIWRSAVRQPPGDGPTPDALSAMVIPTSSEAAAQKLLADLRAYQEAHGLIYITDPLPNMPPSVAFEKQVVSQYGLYRGLYVSGKNVVRTTALEQPLTDEASLSGSYRNLTETMLRVFPAP